MTTSTPNTPPLQKEIETITAHNEFLFVVSLSNHELHTLRQAQGEREKYVEKSE